MRRNFRCQPTTDAIADNIDLFDTESIHNFKCMETKVIDTLQSIIFIGADTARHCGRDNVALRGQSIMERTIFVHKTMHIGNAVKIENRITRPRFINLNSTPLNVDIA